MHYLVGQHQDAVFHHAHNVVRALCALDLPEELLQRAQMGRRLVALVVASALALVVLVVAVRLVLVAALTPALTLVLVVALVVGRAIAAVLLVAARFPRAIASEMADLPTFVALIATAAAAAATLPPSPGHHQHVNEMR